MSNLGVEFNDVVKETTDVPFTADLQDYKTGHGQTNWAKWIHPKTGRRSDAAHGFIQPLLNGPEAQTNLHVICESKTIRVLFDKDDATKAVGVEYTFNPEAKVAATVDQPTQVGEIKTMKARKLVVVSSGAFGTPMILQRSGLGPKALLEKHGVEVVRDIAGVGAEYQDHQVRLIISFENRKSCPC